MLGSSAGELLFGEGVELHQGHVNSMILQHKRHNEGSKDNLFRLMRSGSVEALQEALAPMDVDSPLGKPKRTRVKRGREDEVGGSASQKRQQLPPANDNAKNMLLARGEVGKIPLHVACLYNSENIALELVRQHIINEVPLDLHYKGEPSKCSPFEGENSLHIAVAQGSRRIVKALLREDVPVDEKAELLRGKATGEFFHPPAEHSSSPKEHTGAGMHYF